MEESRRVFIKKLGYSIALSSIYLSGFKEDLSSVGRSLSRTSKKFMFQKDKERVWLGEDFWAIPLEDWRLKSGRIYFQGDMKDARVNVLTTHINSGKGSFKLKMQLGTDKGSPDKVGLAGFLIGINDEIDKDVKAASYYGTGIPIAISTEGYLLVDTTKVALPAGFDYQNIVLECAVITGSATEIQVTAKSSGKKAVNQITLPGDISGYFAIANNIGISAGTRFWFKDLEFEGNKLQDKPDQSFGPILWPMYTLSNKVLKMSVQMPPLSVDDDKQLSFEIRKNGNWVSLQHTSINTTSYQGVFRIPNWDAIKSVPYRITYENEGKQYTYEGIIKDEPDGREMKVAGLTCQHWQAYPYTPLVKNLEKYNPDLLYFSGDQIYEENGGYYIKREPVDDSILSYLGKWYMFGWTFGNLMRNIPTVCTPDDHDVFHGNLWGEAGQILPLEEWTVAKHRDAQGGYVQSPGMINVVHQTNCAHMPDCPDNTNLPSGISTWYTEMIYGGISFAIISDRMFKSGPEEVREGVGRIDHIKTPLPPEQLEKEDLQFLGRRQMEFLEKWIENWSGASMKVLLSQTLFSNVGTHHGNDKMFLYGDMDSGGWPKKQRDDVVKLLRKGYAFHINGDQHLPFMVQYSVDDKQDGGWTFCTPAISTGYIRWGQPDLVNTPYTDRPAHNLPNTGCYPDVFGNTNYIYAVGNPLDKWQHKNRYIQAQNKSSGFGLITFDPNLRTIKMDAYRFLADKDKPSPDDQFPGWPLTILQTDNDGRKFANYLPLLKLNKSAQLVKIYSKSNELINILRVQGREHQFLVPTEGPYTLEIGEGEEMKRFTNIIGNKDKNRALEATI